jgi:hypothetical protein
MRTRDEEYALLAELERQERCMGLYGPYDPRADEVMEGWRSADFGPTQYTDEQRDDSAEFWRSKACEIDKSKAYTAQEIESGERFNAACLQLAAAIDAGKGKR